MAMGSVACSGDDEPTDDNGDDDPVVPDPTGDSGDFEPDLKVAAEVRFIGFIPWDAGKQQVVEARPLGDDASVMRTDFALNLYEAGAFQAGSADGTCTVFYNMLGLGESEEAFAEGFLWGIDIPVGDKGKAVVEDCTVQGGWDPAQWTDGDPLATYGELGFNLRLSSGDIDTELEEWFDGSDVDTEDVAGGDWASLAEGKEKGELVEVFTTDPENNYWLARPMELDKDGVWRVDLDADLLSREEMVANDQLATGFYIFDQNVFWNFAQ